ASIPARSTSSTMQRENSFFRVWHYWSDNSTSDASNVELSRIMPGDLCVYVRRQQDCCAYSCGRTSTHPFPSRPHSVQPEIPCTPCRPACAQLPAVRPLLPEW